MMPFVLSTSLGYSAVAGSLLYVNYTSANVFALVLLGGLTSAQVYNVVNAQKINKKLADEIWYSEELK